MELSWKTFERNFINIYVVMFYLMRDGGGEVIQVQEEKFPLIHVFKKEYSHVNSESF
jgi:hypothetical protein